MRKRVILLLATGALGLAVASPAVADHDDDGFCPTPTAENGRDFAHGHIVPLAHSDTFRLGHDHKPGAEHKGFSGCHPQDS